MKQLDFKKECVFRVDEGKGYIYIDDELGIYTQGDDLEDLRKMIFDVITLTFEHLTEQEINENFPSDDEIKTYVIEDDDDS